jgi:pSer/pThr/pTyr-binding forkhead associated (FHA) protein
LAYLVVTFGGKETQRRKLDGPVTIGRSLDVELAVEDAAISRQHCRIDPQGDHWVVSDLKSRNGTKVNNHTIDRYILNEGDVISIGHTRIVYHAGKLLGPRPADPAAALLSETTVMIARRDPPKRPLPTPRIGRVDESPVIEPSSEETPLPFTRPPARPIVKRVEE